MKLLIKSLIPFFGTLLLVYGISAANVPAGQAKYQQICATCHGGTGKGDGPAAAALNPKPKDLSKTTKNDAQLKEVITKGGAANGLSPTMPAWGTMLSEEDVANIIGYIRTLK